MKEIALSAEAVVPSKIVCIGRNYAAHAAELGNAIPDEMVVFVKSNSAISDQLLSEFGGEKLHFETEICLLHRAGRFTAVGVGLDLTRREKQNELKTKGLPWERCKSFDGAAVLSPFVDFDGELDTLRLELDIDGEVAQRGGVPQMLFPPAQILADLKTFMSLEDHDVVMTGTPAGVGPVRAGAVFDARVFAAEVLVVSQRWVAV